MKKKTKTNIKYDAVNNIKKELNKDYGYNFEETFNNKITERKGHFSRKSLGATSHKV